MAVSQAQTMNPGASRRHARHSHGSMLVALVILTSAGVLSTAFFTLGLTLSRLQDRSHGEFLALGIAEAGAELAIWEFNHHGAQFSAADGWTVCSGAATSSICVQRSSAVSGGTADTVVRNKDSANPSVESTGRPASGGIATKVIVQLANASGTSFLPYAVFANGPNSVTAHTTALTDSYDASVGPYATATARSHGDVATNQTADSSIGISGFSTINGDAYIGSGGTPATGISVASGSVLSGTKRALTAPISLAPVSMPSCDAAHELHEVRLTGTATLQLAAGTYCADDIVMDGTTVGLSTTGAVKLYVRNYIATQNGSWIRSVGGDSVHPEHLQLYLNAGGATIPIGDPNITNTGCPGNRVCVGAWGGSQITATLYAPDAAAAVMSYTDWYGTVVVSSLNLASGHIHFDEHLTAVGSSNTVTVTSWTRQQP